MYDEQGPLRFIRTSNGPERGLGHVRVSWDSALQNQVGSSICGNGNGLPCPVEGYIRHAGSLFDGRLGLPLTARGEVAGPVGGFGWVVEFNAGAPRQIDFENIEVLPETPLLVSIPYPSGTTFTITAHASPWCHENNPTISCTETFKAVDSIDRVRTGPGNEYYVDLDGTVTFRIIQTPHDFVGQPDWFIPSRDEFAVDGSGPALDHFARAGVFLPRHSHFAFFRLVADCEGTGTYCSGTSAPYRSNVCAPGYEQTAYDKCCSIDDISQCTFANGVSSFLTSQWTSSSASASYFFIFVVIAASMVCT